MARPDPRNTTHFWRDSSLPGLSCLTADFTALDFAPHRHDALVVAVTETGGSEFTSRARTHEATARTVLVFNADEPHSSRMRRSTRWRYRAFYLTTHALDGLHHILDTSNTPYFAHNVLHDARLADAFVVLHQRLEAKTLGEDTGAEQAAFTAAFGALFRDHGASDNAHRIRRAPHDRTKVAAVQALLRERYATSLTLGDMSHAVDVTPFQLIEMFKRATGLTPHAFLTQTRLKAAIAAMRRGLSLAESALASGFYDQSALTRHFKRSYGITPEQWVRAAGRNFRQYSPRAGRKR